MTEEFWTGFYFTCGAATALASIALGFVAIFCVVVSLRG